MNKISTSFQSLPEGVYWIYWHAGGRSLATVGKFLDGISWMAPTDRIPAQALTAWNEVAYVEYIGTVSHNNTGMRMLEFSSPITPGAQPAPAPAPVPAPESVPSNVIEVCERLLDHRYIWVEDAQHNLIRTETPCYHACLKENPGIWATGNTIAEAIGDLVQHHATAFNLTVVQLAGPVPR